MKTLRKNIDLDNETIAILQIEATLKGHGSLKPFIESLIKDFAKKCKKNRPAIYNKIVEQRANAPQKKSR